MMRGQPQPPHYQPLQVESVWQHYGKRSDSFGAAGKQWLGGLLGDQTTARVKSSSQDCRLVNTLAARQHGANGLFRSRQRRELIGLFDHDLGHVRHVMFLDETGCFSVQHHFQGPSRSFIQSITTLGQQFRISVHCASPPPPNERAS